MSRATLVGGLGILVFAACSSGSSGGTSGTTGGYTITISGYKFSPDPLVVPAGATITVQNQDVSSTSTHTCSSEASAGIYDGGVAPGGFFFDTGNIDAGTSATISVPAGLASGTKQPYFCHQHTGMMLNPDPVIQIQ
jgi:plastocyanin